MGSEMCIRDRYTGLLKITKNTDALSIVMGHEIAHAVARHSVESCLLYTSDAADDTPCVDLGGRRIIKKKKQPTTP